ncbi:MAG: PaaI family thioesterase [Lysobacteraceae bacterium]|nr:MAG: PaaI family thioesterase [Xanthomonadaceae bacterium]
MRADTMTGLELMQAMLDGRIPMPPMADTVPMQGLSVEAGKILFSARADARHLNPLGRVHGGFAATVLDSVTACAIHTLLGPGESYATVDLNVKMLRPVPVDTALLAEGSVINISRSIAVSEARLKDENGKLYAYASATCMLMRNDG